MKYLTDVLAVGGAACVTTGAAMVSAPLAFLVGGVLMIAGAWLIAIANRPSGEKARAD